MKKGDLVKYMYSPDYAQLPWDRRYDLHGIVIKYCDDTGYFTVAWNDGTYDEDLVYSELVVINEGR